jgi:hypothetical protein
MNNAVIYSLDQLPHDTRKLYRFLLRDRFLPGKFFPEEFAFRFSKDLPAERRLGGRPCLDLGPASGTSRNC